MPREFPPLLTIAGVKGCKNAPRLASALLVECAQRDYIELGLNTAQEVEAALICNLQKKHMSPEARWLLEAIFNQEQSYGACVSFDTSTRQRLRPYVEQLSALAKEDAYRHGYRSPARDWIRRLTLWGMAAIGLATAWLFIPDWQYALVASVVWCIATRLVGMAYNPLTIKGQFIRDAWESRLKDLRYANIDEAETTLPLIMAFGRGGSLPPWCAAYTAFCTTEGHRPEWIEQWWPDSDVLEAMLRVISSYSKTRFNRLRSISHSLRAGSSSAGSDG